MLTVVFSAPGKERIRRMQKNPATPMHTPEKSSDSSISQSVESRHGTVVSVPVVCSEPPRPRYRDRSVCGQSLPTLRSLPYRLPRGPSPQWSVPQRMQFPQWTVSPVVGFPSGQLPQRFPHWSVPRWSVSVSVGRCQSVGGSRSVSVGQCRSVSPVVSFPGGQCRSVVSFPSGKFPKRSVLLVRFPRSVSPVVGLRQLKQARSWSSLDPSSLTSSRRGPRSGQCPR